MGSNRRERARELFETALALDEPERLLHGIGTVLCVRNFLQQC
jgi:hypothetical protein